MNASGRAAAADGSIRDVLDAFSDLRAQDNPTYQQIITFAAALYTPDGFLAFLTARLDEFGGRTALELIESGHAVRVLEFLADDYDGLGY
jgi:hypothetical protein